LGSGFGVGAIATAAGAGGRRESEYRWNATPIAKQTTPTSAVLMNRFTWPPYGVFYLPAAIL
jgi:hypothetical protein